MSRDAVLFLQRMLLATAASLGCITARADEPSAQPAEEAHAYASDLTPSPAEPSPPEPARLSDTSRPPDKLPAETEKTEMITERYPNRAVKVERRVIQDESGNYLNHGSWTYWNQQGEMIGSGEYKYGHRTGKWIRWFEANEATMFGGPNFKHFQAPFGSEVTFVDGKMQGLWVCYDANNRKVCTFDLVDGQLNGKAVWFYPTGHKRREVDYRDSRADGLAMEWTLEERAVPPQTKGGKPSTEVVHKLVNKVVYEDGRKLMAHTEYYAPGIKKTEGEYLAPSDNPVITYDWWNGVVKQDEGKPATAAPDKGQRHGVWTSWFKDGSKQWQGEYDRGQPVGTHVWWHINGQRSAEGRFEHGKETGKWTWWHTNGQKSIQGEYVQGGQSGAWTRWSEAGKVLDVEEFTPNRVIDKPQIANEETVKRPTRLPAVQLEADGRSSRRPKTPLRR